MSGQAIFRSPGSLLASSFFARGSSPELILITGPSGSGKTAWCLQLSQVAQTAGWIPCGLISPAVFTNAEKEGIDLLDVASGERRRLAVRKKEAERKDPAHLETLRWHFDPQVLIWGNEILAHIQPDSLLILDELGPLEFLEGHGLTSGLQLIDLRQYRLACVVVRPVLVSTALNRWPWAQVLDVRCGSMDGTV